ncbi:hypothetical protein M433DRAFT_155334 [Acidomyces richmondensis BFW]|nr:MAG: hypothetical protein FE78DRAFT_92064 [Acidomyces sp. 'richmondensis']KYG44692.1 hypothetical protein M433DRAFT_155334 [Acidomyces richmondensis BFW]
MFSFTPLLGAQSESRATQSLLELDGGVKIAVDVGWDATFSGEKLRALEQHAPTLSFVLLTHPTLHHLGAYAHCCKHWPRFAHVPVYATTPVINLGRALLTDLYGSAPLASSAIPSTNLPHDSSDILLPPPTAEEIATYFARIHPLKYSQPHQPAPAPWSPSLGGLTITAYGAGHTLGGTIWHIQQGMESIVYATDFSQGRENLIPGTTLLAGGQEIIEPLRRPTALVCSAKGVQRPEVPKGHTKRDDILIALVRETISQGGKVLIPTDSSARVLELAFVLNQNWHANIDGPQADTYKRARIYLATKSCSNTVRFLQSMLEWVEDSVRSETEAVLTAKQGKDGQEQVSPLDWQYVKLVQSERQMDQTLRRQKPCVILASDLSLEWGFSQQALEALASDSKNLVILPEPVRHTGSTNDGVGRRLWDAWQSQPGQISEQSGAKVVSMDGMTVDLRELETKALDSNETTLYETFLARQQQLHSSLQGENTEPDSTAHVLEEPDEESDSDDEEDEDAEHQGRALNISAQFTQSNKRKAAGLSDADLGVNVLLRGKGVYDYDVRNRRGRDKIFPFITYRARDTEYGEEIKADDYLRAEERNTADGMDTHGGASNEITVGQKRKWDDLATSRGGAAHRGSKSGSQNKRQKEEKSKPREPDDIDAAIARATGQALPEAGTNDESESSSDDIDESDYEPEHGLSGGPRKVISTVKKLALHMQVSHVDFSGLHELRDLQMIVSLMRPRKVILTSGDVDETRTLEQGLKEAFAKQQGVSTGPTATEIFLPKVGELVDASVDTNSWALKLSRQLLRRIHPQKVREGLEIVAITGRLTVEPVDSSKESAMKDINGTKKKARLIEPQPLEGKKEDSSTLGMPVLDLLTTTTASSLSSTTNNPHHQQRSHVIPQQPVHVGDLRLAPLRARLETLGHTCLLRGEGTILVDGTVLVRKSATGGRVEVESTMPRGLEVPAQRTLDREGSFYAVRRAVYSGLAVVGGRGV